MLLSSILFISSLLFKEILTGLILFFIVILYYFLKNETQKISMKNLYFLILFCFSIFIVNIFYYKNGKIIFNNAFFSISDSGLENGIISFLRIVNMFFIGKCVKSFKLVGFLEKYNLIASLAIKNSGFIFDSFKNKIGIKKTYLKLIRKIYREINNNIK